MKRYNFVTVHKVTIFNAKPRGGKIMYAMYFVAVGSLAALLFAASMFAKVKKQPEGNSEMIRISTAVREGANAYLKRQYKGIGIFFAVMFVILLVMAFSGLLGFFTPFAFLTGGFFSGLSGFIGMRTATMANCRTAEGASHSLNRGLKVAFSAGSVMGFTVVGLGLLDITIWYTILNVVFGSLPEAERIAQVTTNMLTFGMGASSMALFARVGGGIFTKAADVGADLVGKVEAGIPEDDPRNPAVIADNVGDNVGDVAGMGADLYESYVGSILSTFALAVAAGLGVKGVAVPMLLAAMGVIFSIIGTFFVSTKEDASQKSLLQALRKGTNISAVLIIIAAFVAVKILLPDNMGVYAAIISGLIAGVLIGALTEYYTSDSYKPTQNLAASSETGSATVIISGLSLGMLSTVAPVIIVGISVLVSYFCAGGASDFNLGLYGVGVSAVGMLSTTGMTVAVDAYGPVSDNAGGIAEMSELPEHVREITDKLDSVGNTTAAIGKGFAIGSAALTALALFASFSEVAKIEDISLLQPIVIVGLFIGAMLPFMFSAFTMNSVGRAANQMIEEVRRQFRSDKGIMEGTSKPDYANCVDISTSAALKEMIVPGLMAIIAPLLIGILLGVEALGGMLAGALSSGVLLAIMMANAGGAWDNAKKYIEEGHFGGKGSDSHKAAVVGDTVGDPFKDTSGPSINILIKLMTIVSLVFAPLFLSVGGIL